MRRIWWLLVGVGLGLGLAQVQAQSPMPDQVAGLVVRFSEEQVATYCLAVDSAGLSGFDLLTRAGLAPTTQVGGVGAAVCRLQAVGCPADDCFCACRGGPDCTYWSYWHWQADAWRYASTGADRYQVMPGSVDGWSWGRGAEGEAPPPPELSLAEICADGLSAPAISASASAARPPVLGYVAFGALCVLLLLLIRRGRPT